MIVSKTQENVTIMAKSVRLHHGYVMRTQGRPGQISELFYQLSKTEQLLYKPMELYICINRRPFISVRLDESCGPTPVGNLYLMWL